MPDLSIKFKILILVWFFGWGFLLAMFPVQGYRLLSWGRIPTPKELKAGKIVGFMAFAYGFLFLLELAFSATR
jgi:hypothetical protein